MTAIDVSYHYRGPLTAEQIRALAQVPDIYGIRALKVDESGQKLTIEYDATRMGEPMVAAIVRRCGIAVSAPVDAMAPA